MTFKNELAKEAEKITAEIKRRLGQDMQKLPAWVHLTNVAQQPERDADLMARLSY